MKIIFCDSVMDNKLVEPDYQSEFDAAKENGFETEIFSYEALEEGSLSNALKYIKSSEDKAMAIYRGWMMPPNMYKQFYDGLLRKNIQLINSPEAYRHCHHLPESYEKIKDKTPKSIWTTDISIANIINLSSKFGDKPIIIKDYVKSEKHKWNEACFIPKASDKDCVERIATKFLELRGKHLNEGIVLRAFVDLKFLTNHSKSNMPLTTEFRAVVFNKNIIGIFNYWDEGVYASENLDINIFRDNINAINSNFFTIDIAKKKDDDWIIMELGDGQVAGLPDNVNRISFYSKLRQIINKNK
ncbi:ATP-grasp domain-containing protein [Winogradskyella sp.]|uniref:ATP-grasp domain-containing protein n=1 Tax=Winogradskyella sp. TaxID=1883156 RepID=UPI003BAA2BC6